MREICLQGFLKNHKFFLSTCTVRFMLNVVTLKICNKRYNSAGRAPPSKHNPPSIKDCAGASLDPGLRFYPANVAIVISTGAVNDGSWPVQDSLPHITKLSLLSGLARHHFTSQAYLAVERDRLVPRHSHVQGLLQDDGHLRPRGGRQGGQEAGEQDSWRHRTHLCCKSQGRSTCILKPPI